MAGSVGTVLLVQLICRLSVDVEETTVTTEWPTVVASARHLSVNHFNCRRANQPHHLYESSERRFYYKCAIRERGEHRCELVKPVLSVNANGERGPTNGLVYSPLIKFDFRVANFNLSGAGGASAPFWLTLPGYESENAETTILQCDELYPCDEPSPSIGCALKRHLPPDWPLALTAVLLVIGGTVGNALVCFAVWLERKLQNVTNYFLVSLAMADLLVCVFVMPMAAVQAFYGYWPLGFAWCSVYVSCDVLACSSSIMHMCTISLGRYLGIRNPLKSRQKYSTKKLVGYKITLVWALSLLVAASVSILGLRNEKNIMPEAHVCTINNRAFFVLGSLVAFYIPMLIMMVTYALTVKLLRDKASFLNQLPPPTAPSAQPSQPHQLTDHRRNCDRTNCGVTDNQLSTSSNVIAQPTEFETCQTKSASALSLRNIATVARSCKRFGRKLEVNPSHETAASSLRIRGSSGRKMGSGAVRTEQKASKVLGVVFFTFALCWSPFFTLNIVFAVCPENRCDIPAHIIEFTMWLGYFSSTINPIIYTVFNRTFRSSFISLLRCQWKNLSRRPTHLTLKKNGLRYSSATNSTVNAQTPASVASNRVLLPTIQFSQ